MVTIDAIVGGEETIISSFCSVLSLRVSPNSATSPSVIAYREKNNLFSFTWLWGQQVENELCRFYFLLVIERRNGVSSNCTDKIIWYRNMTLACFITPNNG